MSVINGRDNILHLIEEDRSSDRGFTPIDVGGELTFAPGGNHRMNYVTIAMMDGDETNVICDLFPLCLNGFVVVDQKGFISVKRDDEKGEGESERMDDNYVENFVTIKNRFPQCIKVRVIDGTTNNVAALLDNDIKSDEEFTRIDSNSELIFASGAKHRPNFVTIKTMDGDKTKIICDIFPFRWNECIAVSSGGFVGIEKTADETEGNREDSEADKGAAGTILSGFAGIFRT